LVGLNTFARIFTLGLAGRKKLETAVAPPPSNIRQRRRPPDAPIVGKAIHRSELGATQVAATLPPDAAGAESASTAAARLVAARTRRRAAGVASGKAGRSLSPAQQLVGAGGAKRSLLGY
jgi:hypothetical protein